MNKTKRRTLIRQARKNLQRATEFLDLEGSYGEQQAISHLRAAENILEDLRAAYTAGRLK